MMSPDGPSAHRLLIVEDDVEIRSTMEELLLDEGFDVVTAGNGQEALDHLRGTRHLPFAILLDLRMPVMDGRTFLSRRAAEPAWAGIPVIVLTADHASCRVVGASSVLIKPFPLDRLLQELSDLR